MSENNETACTDLPPIPAKSKKYNIQSDSVSENFDSKFKNISSPKLLCRRMPKGKNDFTFDAPINDLPSPLDTTTNGFFNGYPIDHESLIDVEFPYPPPLISKSLTYTCDPDNLNDKQSNIIPTFTMDSLKLAKQSKISIPLNFIDEAVMKDDDIDNQDDDDEIDYVLIDSNSNQFKSFNHSLQLTYIDDLEKESSLYILPNGLEYYERDGLVPMDNSDKPCKVQFSIHPIKVFLTHSIDEYDRRNVDVDPATASIEYELEKRLEHLDILTIEINKGNEGLGLSIIGIGLEADTNLEKLAIFVKMLVPGGAAQRDGRIQVNDQIIEVNDKCLVGVSQSFATSILKSTSNVVKFVIGREKMNNVKLLSKITPTIIKTPNPENSIYNEEFNKIQTNINKDLSFSPKNFSNNNVASLRSYDLSNTKSMDLSVDRTVDKSMNKDFGDVDWSLHDNKIVPYVEVSEFLSNSVEVNSTKYKQVEKKYIKAKKLIKEYKKRENDYLKERENLVNENKDMELHFNNLVKTLKNKIFILECELRNKTETNTLAELYSAADKGTSHNTIIADTIQPTTSNLITSFVDNQSNIINLTEGSLDLADSSQCVVFNADSCDINRVANQQPVFINKKFTASNEQNSAKNCIMNVGKNESDLYLINATKINNFELKFEAEQFSKSETNIFEFDGVGSVSNYLPLKPIETSLDISSSSSVCSPDEKDLHHNDLSDCQITQSNLPSLKCQNLKSCEEQNVSQQAKIVLGQCNSQTSKNNVLQNSNIPQSLINNQQNFLLKSTIVEANQNLINESIMQIKNEIVKQSIITVDKHIDNFKETNDSIQLHIANNHKSITGLNDTIKGPIKHAPLVNMSGQDGDIEIKAAPMFCTIVKTENNCILENKNIASNISNRPVSKLKQPLNKILKPVLPVSKDVKDEDVKDAEGASALSQSLSSEPQASKNLFMNCSLNEKRANILWTNNKSCLNDDAVTQKNVIAGSSGVVAKPRLSKIKPSLENILKKNDSSPVTLLKSSERLCKKPTNCVMNTKEDTLPNDQKETLGRVQSVLEKFSRPISSNLPVAKRYEKNNTPVEVLPRPMSIGNNQLQSEIRNVLLKRINALNHNVNQKSDTNQMSNSLDSNGCNNETSFLERPSSNTSTQKSSAAKWNLEEILDWLRLNDLNEYVPIFQRRPINGATLLQLNSNKIKALGLTTAECSDRLKVALKQLRLEMEQEKKEKSTDCDSALIPLLCVHG